MAPRRLRTQVPDQSPPTQPAAEQGQAARRRTGRATRVQASG